jgi:hypothetical protein
LEEDSDISMFFPHFSSSINWKERTKESKKTKDKKFAKLQN